MSSWPVTGTSTAAASAPLRRKTPLQSGQQVVLHIWAADLRPRDSESSTDDECDERGYEHVVAVRPGLDDVELEQKRQPHRGDGDERRFQARDRERHQHDQEPRGGDPEHCARVVRKVREERRHDAQPVHGLVGECRVRVQPSGGRRPLLQCSR